MGCKHNWKEIDFGWDFDKKFNWVIEECASCGAMQELTRDGWVSR